MLYIIPPCSSAGGSQCLRDHMHKLMLNVILISGLCRKKSLFVILSNAGFVAFLLFRIMPITIAQFI